MKSFLTIDGRNVSKKTKLVYRVLVSPVPPNFDVYCILSHKLFADRVVAHSHINDHLILELDVIDNYDNCLTIGALRIDNNIMQIIPHTVVSDPDTSEINAETGMQQICGYDLTKQNYPMEKKFEAEMKTPYTSTNVMVVNEDCLILYEKLVFEGYRSLLLNMANATGGGYRKGDGAQEENLFRRSDYYQSLDADKSEKADGYAYMKSPLYNACAIAVAAYRDPELSNKNMLENKFAINTHRKIENIFAIAHHHKHDSILFKSVIYQNAGFLKNIYFTVVDDHNTGNKINPNANLVPFKKILNGLVIQPPKKIRIKGVTGPNRVLDRSPDGQVTLSDVCTAYLPPCQHGAKCHDLKNLQHNSIYLHPPMCSQQDITSSCAQINDEVHMFTFIHNIKCKYSGECDSTDPKHLSEYDHPDFCKNDHVSVAPFSGLNMSIDFVCNQDH
ncbi:unnamed protein product [Didymodactylos carnosus]|uniref:Microbial-type PARG catalytic domain-containing protein n=1 Tax=Didymodactylos carnosus TaxID=1234261 RepID=A0A814KD89_9BILA|nr:unnamed protein product [Didymodactylos carnosus]CAF3819105.1 unnamed protein product [Didymodactylos carnosus]